MRDIIFEASASSRASREFKTIVVAGGAGFLGSNLCRRLLDQGHKVICVDNLLTGDMENVSELVNRSGFQFRRHDIINPLRLDGPIDEIYNLACAASPPLYQKDPIHTFRTNVDGTLNLLTLAEAKGARILQSSTSEVYGDPEISLQHEGYRGNVNTCGPRACYDEGKRASETLFWEFGEHRGVQTRIARIFNTYGPRMHPEDGRVVSNFIVQALCGEALTVYGNGLQTRSFCYVDDMINALMALMASDEKLPVNLGNPGEFTMLELAQKILGELGSDLPIVFRPMPTDDPRQRRPDISRAWDVLHWAPLVGLDQGLDKTIDWFARRLKSDRMKGALVS